MVLSKWKDGTDGFFKHHTAMTKPSYNLWVLHRISLIQQMLLAAQMQWLALSPYSGSDQISHQWKDIILSFTGKRISLILAVLCERGDIFSLVRCLVTYWIAILFFFTRRMSFERFRLAINLLNRHFQFLVSYFIHDFNVLSANAGKCFDPIRYLWFIQKARSGHHIICFEETVLNSRWKTFGEYWWTKWATLINMFDFQNISNKEQLF